MLLMLRAPKPTDPFKLCLLIRLSSASVDAVRSHPAKCSRGDKCEKRMLRRKILLLPHRRPRATHKKKNDEHCSECASPQLKASNAGAQKDRNTDEIKSADNKKAAPTIVRPFCGVGRDGVCPHACSPLQYDMHTECL